ncbi:MAG: hypothetical protein A2Z93_13810 [Curvibacter sp. GWA2_64_110]|nr:MAG: hypothetical protein A2Z93_13810 [Curvibacter sp. GWA2_64_110]HCY17293.1 hypothetical protein [Curvibacter sp.]
MLGLRRLPALLPRIIGGLLLVLLTGCSAVKTGYNSAPTLLYWWLDGYVDFNEAQDKPVRDSLAALHAWHRQQELPAYADLLNRMQQLAGGPVSLELVCTFVDQIRAHMLRLAEQSADGLAQVAPTLQDEQLRRLAQQFEKNNQKWREEWLDGSPAELLERRLARTVDRYEDFYGRLTDAQKTLLRQRLSASSLDARTAWAERLRRQQDMLRVFQEHRGTDRPAHVQAEMLALTKRNLESPEPAYRAQFERMLQEGCQIMALLHNSASAAQRRQFIGKLQGYEADFRALAAEP